jgi:maltose alpha-D-glucosyltransferase/alpha-amylase
MVPGRAPDPRLALPRLLCLERQRGTLSRGTHLIIFTDSESSNWTWDPVANAYYWHRFFHHQPDLNYENPAVRREILDAMHFWLGKGLDGFRCDAVPYLFEREGTDCENLPETHGFLREVRRQIETRHTGRLLLAEANQRSSDVRAYFGDGDEFHMALHFPLMPRIFLAVCHGDRRPITDVFLHAPEIPPACQWGLFLRNHDELTLEMVTAEERHQLYSAYGAAPRMRLNLGIRRRLAPLLDNDPRKIKLLTSLLFTLPGSPVLYYGDEIGMGDNIYLADRNGVRTPMQWTGDRNAGFSRADTARLHLPLIVDPVYGYQAVNVEAQRRTPSSLLHWMKQIIGVRKKTRVFGRGSLHVLQPANESVLAHVRSHERETVLAVHNLSGTAQPVQLDLRPWIGHTPVEMLGESRFPVIGERPYDISLAPYGYFWFRLQGP